MGKRKRIHSILLTRKTINLYLEFIKILNEEEMESGEIDVTFFKHEIIKKMDERGFKVTMSKIHSFTEMAVITQNSKPIFDLQDKVAVR